MNDEPKEAGRKAAPRMMGGMAIGAIAAIVLVVLLMYLLRR